MKTELEEKLISFFEDNLADLKPEKGWSGWLDIENNLKETKSTSDPPENIVISFKSGVDPERLEWLRAHRPTQQDIKAGRAYATLDSELYSPARFDDLVKQVKCENGGNAPKISIIGLKNLIDFYSGKSIPCEFRHTFCKQSCKTK